MLVAVNVDASERQIEGDYWLASLLGASFLCPEDLVHATDIFEAGWLVVRIQWYKLVQVKSAWVCLGERGACDPCVNTIVGLLGLAFSNSSAAGTPSVSAERVVTRQGKLHFFDEDSHNLVEAACRHQDEEEAGAEEHADGS